MPNYLQNADLAAFGVPNATPDQIQRASAQIDAYTGRREGLIWTPDASGNPCYMVGLQPSITLTAATAITPGTNVVVTVAGPTTMIQVGDVYVIDIAAPAVTEALKVVSITGNQIVFYQANFAHAVGAILAGGLVINEKRIMPQNRPITRVSRTPVANVLSGVGRYGYMRRGDDAIGSIDTYNLLAVMSKFGGPPAWETWTPQANSIDPQTGDIWVPAGILLAYYTEVRIWYVAGWTYATLPYEIKQACANIVNSETALAGLPGTVQSFKSGDTALTRFQKIGNNVNSLLIDDDTKQLLEPYRVQVMA